MRLDLKRALPRTAAMQVVAVVVLAVVVGVFATAITLTAVAGSARMRMNPDVKAASEAARIAIVTRSVAGAPSNAAAANIVEGAQSTTGSVALVDSHHAPPPAPPSAFTRRVVEHLRVDWRLQPAIVGSDTVGVRATPDRLLVFQESEFQTLRTFLTFQACVSLALIFCVVCALAFYAARWITRPLATIADAAHAFARSPNDESPLGDGGPTEIRQLADAFTTMRDRTRRLIHDRGQMMAAISHDMRTPLTRLRLRADRAAHDDDRAAMLADISLMESMIREALTYLRDGRATEPPQRIDLPALLRTICDQAQDLGHCVTYSGPARLAYHGQSNALQRAVSNLVDNATRHGDAVVVTLESGRDATQIIVSDDGPGIPAALRERVFEPFFKIGDARTARGFGLGLSIARDIVERHHGTIELHDHHPHGLSVQVSLPAESAQLPARETGTPDIPSPAQAQDWPPSNIS